MSIPEERLTEFRAIADSSNRHVAHILGKHPLPRDTAAQCGLCENEILRTDLKYAQQKLDLLGRIADDWDDGTKSEHAVLAREVREVAEAPGCCCCPVGCKECQVDSARCECPEHGDDHDTRCLGVAPSITDTDGVKA